MNMNDAFVGSLIFNKNGGGGGASAMSDLTDVNITSPSEGETLIYDSTSEQWVNGQGGGKQIALTQAQYDALVQAGTVDPTMEYFITDGIPASVEYYHNYSTTEHVVGTWIDGSTIYERTISLSEPIQISGSGSTTISTNYFNQVGQPIDITLYTIDPGTGNNRYVWRWVTAGINKTTGELTLFNGRNSGVLTFDTFTIQYIKLASS